MVSGLVTGLASLCEPGLQVAQVRRPPCSRCSTRFQLLETEGRRSRTLLKPRSLPPTAAPMTVSASCRCAARRCAGAAQAGHRRQHSSGTPCCTSRGRVGPGSKPCRPGLLVLPAWSGPGPVAASQKRILSAPSPGLRKLPKARANHAPTAAIELGHQGRHKREEASGTSKSGNPRSRPTETACHAARSWAILTAVRRPSTGSGSGPSDDHSGQCQGSPVLPHRGRVLRRRAARWRPSLQSDATCRPARSCATAGAAAAAWPTPLGAAVLKPKRRTFPGWRGARGLSSAMAAPHEMCFGEKQGVAEIRATPVAMRVAAGG